MFLGEYISNHWNGKLSLPKSYWLNFIIFGWIMKILYLLVNDIDEQVGKLVAVSVVAFMVWALVGVWRSAGKRGDDGKSVDGWGLVARIIVGGNAIYLAYAFLVGVLNS